MKRTALAVSIYACMAPSAAFAFDWSIRASENETVEVNSNPFLRSSQAGALSSYSTLSADAEARTPTTKFLLSGDGSYRKYWGPGVSGVADEFLSYGFKARYEASEKTRFDREYLETSFRQQSLALALLRDLGVSIPTSGFINRLDVTGGIDRSLTSLDTLSIFATSVRTTYEPSGGGTAFTDTIARGNWRHSLNSQTSISVSSEGELLDYDNAFNTRVQIYRNQIGIDSTLSAVLSFRANVGAAYISTERGVGGSLFSGTTSSVPRPSSALDWIGDAVLTYRVLKNTTLTLSAVQSIGPTVTGSLTKRDSISAGLTQTINSNSSLTFSASADRQIANLSTDNVSASATYSRTLTRDWTSQFTYRYQRRFASSGGTSIIDSITGTPTVGGIGPADSHSLMVSITHNWTLLPSGN